MAEMTFQRGCMSVSFSAWLSRSPPFPPLALDVTGDLDKEDSRDGRSGYDIGGGLTGCDGGIDKRPREEVIFGSPSPPFFGSPPKIRLARCDS
jgi:hypothetical protein